MPENESLIILSIDAWATGGDEENPSWEWNNWHKVGTISKEEFEALDTDEKVIEWFCKDYITCADLVAVEDDQYNLVIVEKANGRPIYAIEAGSRCC
jgi:hypothetical protein